MAPAIEPGGRRMGRGAGAIGREEGASVETDK